MADVREALTAEFGFEWVAKGESTATYEPNRFRGMSLLNLWDSVTWQTTQTLRTVADKERAVELVSEVLERDGFGSPTLLNFDGPAAIGDFGGFTRKDQGRWVMKAQPPEVTRGGMQFTILDLSNDRTEMLRAQSDADVAALGWEPEYLSIGYHGDYMLKESDRAEFERRAALYAGHIQPVPGKNKD